MQIVVIDVTYLKCTLEGSNYNTANTINKITLQLQKVYFFELNNHVPGVYWILSKRITLV